MATSLSWSVCSLTPEVHGYLPILLSLCLASYSRGSWLTQCLIQSVLFLLRSMSNSLYLQSVSVLFLFSLSVPLLPMFMATSLYCSDFPLPPEVHGCLTILSSLCLSSYSRDPWLHHCHAQSAPILLLAWSMATSLSCSVCPFILSSCMLFINPSEPLPLLPFLVEC